MLRKTPKFFVGVLISFAVTLILITAASAQADLSDKVVILDAGHGTVGSPGYAGYREAPTMLRLANKIKPLLEAHGITVLMTREDGRDVPLAERVALINTWTLEELRRARPNDTAEIDRLLGIMQRIIRDYDTYARIYMNFPFTYQRTIHPDLRRIFELQAEPVIRDRFLVISLHSDSTNYPIDHSVNGATAFHITNNFDRNRYYFTDYANEERSRNFGLRMLERINELGIRSRGTRTMAFFILREHNLPAVLIENGFHTNPQDRARLSDDAFLARLAQAYAETIIEHFMEIIGADTIQEVTRYPEEPYLPEDTNENENEDADKYEDKELSDEDETICDECDESADLGEPEIPEEPVVSVVLAESQHISRTFRVYREPSFDSGGLALFSPQEVTVRARTADGWALISTSFGRHWVYVPEYHVLTASERVHMPYIFNVHRSPHSASDIIATFSPQEVIVRARTADGWALISTGSGRYWAYTG